MIATGHPFCAAALKGRYIEVLDPGDGRRIGHRFLGRDARRPPPQPR